MKNKNKPIFIALSAVYIIIGLYIAENIIVYSNIYKSDKEIYTQNINYEKRLLNKDEWVSGNLEIKWRNRDIVNLKPADNIPKFSSNFLLSKAYKYSDYFLATALVYFLIIFIIFRKNRNFNTFFATSLIITAVLSLYVGLFSPMMEISAFKNNMTINFDIEKINFRKTFQGDMYFYYKSKSVIQLITFLLNSKNIIVGFSILIFSVILPVFKMLVSALLITNYSLNKNNFFNFVINKTGKWSMADVFVVAAYLAFLSFNNLNAGVTVNSNILPGLFFFLSYCILSLISTYFIVKINKGKQKVKYN